MIYKHYTAKVTYDSDEGYLVGHIAGITDIVGFQADTVAGLKAEFHKSVDVYLAACARKGKSPQKPCSGEPYSGNMMFRVAPDIHRRVAQAAQSDGISLNQWGKNALERALTQEEARRSAP